MPTLFQSEKDSIAFLGLMSIAFKNFDFQFKHLDNQLTHAKGLNIFAAILDNVDGNLVAQEQNQIHLQNNPMLHAEQLALKQAIETINKKRPRNNSLTSVESYYRNYLFNDPASLDPLNSGCTIYTTLEPCPFCTSALLVNRMKRIVFVIPDKKFGNAYTMLKTAYYPSYDMHYEQLAITPHPESTLTQTAHGLYKKLLQLIDEIKQAEPNLYDTLLLDRLNSFLRECYDHFKKLSANDLATIAPEKTKNLKTLLDIQSKT